MQLTILLETLRLAGFCAGCILLYICIFAYEDEEENIQDKLEEWWVRIDDMRIDNLSKTTRFMLNIVDALGILLDRVFGEKLLSAQMASVSTCLSVSCILLLAPPIFWWFLSVPILAAPHIDTTSTITAASDWLDWIVHLSWTILKFLLGLHLARAALAPLRGGDYPRREFHLILIWTGSLPTLPIIGHLLTGSNNDAAPHFYLIYFTWFFILLGTLASDILFTVGARFAIRHARRFNSGFRILLLMSVSAGLISFLTAIPFSVAMELNLVDYPEALRTEDIFPHFSLPIILLMIACSNIPSCLISVAFIFLGALRLACSIFWFAFSRPIYSLQRNEAIKNKKLLWALALFLFVASTPDLAGFLKNLAGAIGVK